MTNDNGERFADMRAVNNLVIGRRISPHKPIHKATWRLPDLKSENQIDHLCISKKFIRSLLDARVVGAPILNQITICWFFE